MEKGMQIALMRSGLVEAIKAMAELEYDSLTVA